MPKINQIVIIKYKKDILNIQLYLSVVNFFFNFLILIIIEKLDFKIKWFLKFSYYRSTTYLIYVFIFYFEFWHQILLHDAPFKKDQKNQKAIITWNWIIFSHIIIYIYLTNYFTIYATHPFHLNKCNVKPMCETNNARSLYSKYLWIPKTIFFDVYS